MDGAIVADKFDPNGLDTATEICENPSPENSPSSASEKEVNIKSLDTDTHDSLVNSEQCCEAKTDECSTDSFSEPVQNGTCNGNATRKKPKRNVSFPTDTFVMGFLEPPDPWKNAPNWKTEDLLRAYKSSCEKHGTKPLNKILQQLQCIENVGERYEILSLKGERLDMKQCESLEEIFMRVRFRCIDLEATHLDDEVLGTFFLSNQNDRGFDEGLVQIIMAVSIFEMVEYYESACKLNISFNKTIGPRGWQSCARLVRKTPCLTFIDARNCDLNDRMIPILGRSLRMGCYLTRLHLQSANLAGRALVILVAALKMNETLKELFIGDNKFMPTDGIQIGNLLKYNHKLELLDLRNNHLQDVGVSHICDGLAEQSLDTGLLTLVLWNNQLTFQAMASLNRALNTAVNLETLNLGHNPLTNEGIHILKDGLLKTRSLLKLGLSGTKVTCEGAVALAEVIADSHRMVRLDLQENDIKTAGLMALSLALKMNESLTRLELDRDTKRESGVKDYVQQQKRLQQEITTLLERNRDVAHQLEEERKQIELKNRENAKKLEEAARDLETSTVTNEYIPSEDTIHRPKLLFFPNMCPERELDSPLGGEFFPQSNPSVPHLTLAPAGADLLSPQYCPNPKATAKKLFTVSRVLSPPLTSPSSDAPVSVVTSTLTSTDLLNSAAASLTGPHLCPPLPGVPELGTTSTSISVGSEASPTSPNSIQRVIEEHTLVSYIQQIISDSSNLMHTPHTGHAAEHRHLANDINSTEVTVADNSQSDCDKEVSVEDAPVSSGDVNNSTLESNNDLVKTKRNKEEVSVTNVGTDECSSVEISDSQTMVQAGGETNQDCDTDTVDIPNNTDTPINHSSHELVHADRDSQNTSNNTINNKHFVEGGSNKSSEEEASHKAEEIVKAVLQGQCPTDTGEDSELNSEFVDCLSLDTSSEPDPAGSGPALAKNVGSSDLEGSACGMPTEESGDPPAQYTEQWNTVSKQEIIDTESPGPVGQCADTNANAKKPDFHTNLSLNGLKQELASLIDEEGNPTTAPVNQGEKDSYNTANGVEIAPDWIDASTAVNISAS